MCLTPSLFKLDQQQCSTPQHIQVLVELPQLANNLLNEVQAIQRFSKPHEGIQPSIYLYALFAYTLNHLEPTAIVLTMPVSYVCCRALPNV